MSRRARALGPAVLLLLLLGQASLADELGRAVELALARNPGLAAAGARVQAASAGERAAFALYLPTLDLSLRGGYGWEPAALVPDGRLANYWEAEAQLELRQRLWDGGRRSSALDQAAAESAAAEARRAAAEEEIARQVMEAYLTGAEATERASLLSDAIADLRGLGGLIEEQIKGGLATTAERHQLATRLDFLAAELALAAGERAAAEARLQSLTGETAFAFTLPPFPATRLPADGVAALTRALAAQPTLAEARALIAVREAAKGAAEAEYWPTLDFVLIGRLAQHPAGLADSREELLALLQLRWRLFDGYGRSALNQQRAREAAASGYQLAERQRQLQREMAQAFARLAMLGRRQPALAAGTQAAARTFRLYREQFGIGRRSLLDLVDARQELLARTREELEGEVTRLRAAFTLAFSLGELQIWLTEPPPGQSTAAPLAFQLAAVGDFTPLPTEGVPVSAAVRLSIAARAAAVPSAPVANLVVAPAVPGKLGSGPGLADLTQKLLLNGNL